MILTLVISLFEAAYILPAHLAHSKALEQKEKKLTGVMGFFNKINQKSEQALFFVRDKLYAPYLRFFIHHRFLGIAIPTAMMILAFGTISSGIVKTAFFPVLRVMHSGLILPCRRVQMKGSQILLLQPSKTKPG
ncbi:MAG: hypothetical protein U5K51_03340 [Flavobacteriaceae bacterium]|nr:hypothetical protein [Flavobacteriaceae bacterium]